jgi:hypothetical protein
MNELILPNSPEKVRHVCLTIDPFKEFRLTNTLKLYGIPDVLSVGGREEWSQNEQGNRLQVTQEAVAHKYKQMSFSRAITNNRK